MANRSPEGPADPFVRLPIDPRAIELLRTGNDLEVAFESMAEQWPLKDGRHRCPESERDTLQSCVLAIERWVNAISMLLGGLAMGEEYAKALSFQAGQFNRAAGIYQPGTRALIFSQGGVALRSIPSSVPQPSERSRASTLSYEPNTAFILMWMSEENDTLQDVVEGIKSVFGEFGIDARRSDDVEHAETITQGILEEIRKAEFLIADLTGERPNVYYEVGFAHAIGKRPILFRRKGTPLHFDLSVHHVPEYRNVTHLKSILRNRLTTIAGRLPSQPSRLT
jgi:hypothetical protein